MKKEFVPPLAIRLSKFIIVIHYAVISAAKYTTHYLLPPLLYLCSYLLMIALPAAVCNFIEGSSRCLHGVGMALKDFFEFLFDK
jgi:hypothetical protein